MADLSTIGADWIPGTVFLTRTTDTDHSGWLFAVTILCMLYTLTLLVITSATRREWMPSDWAFLGTSLFALTSNAVVLAALPSGLGKASDLIAAGARQSSLQDACHPGFSAISHTRLTDGSLVVLTRPCISFAMEAPSSRQHWRSIACSNPERVD